MLVPVLALVTDTRSMVGYFRDSMESGNARVAVMLFALEAEVVIPFQ